MSNEQRYYLSYLLRLWKEPLTTQSVWRASLEGPQTGEVTGFGDVSQLFAFLEERIAGPAPRAASETTARTAGLPPADPPFSPGAAHNRLPEYMPARSSSNDDKENQKMTLEHEPVLSPTMPRGLGPYSQVVRAGDFLFVSGQTGLDPATGNPAGETFEQQARQAFANLSTVLQAADSSLAHVVKTTVFCADPTAFATLNQIYAESFPDNPPARSAPIVQLPRGLLVSIECIAVRGEQSQES